MDKFNVIIYDFNAEKFKPYDILPYLTEEYYKSDEKPKTVKEVREFILRKSSYQWRARTEYEIILVDWPCYKKEEKWDIFKQIEMNIDVITKLFIKNISRKRK